MPTRFLSLLVLVFLALLIDAKAAGPSTDDGLTDVVAWDRNSLIVDKKRVFIFAGEFHYQRLPVPELWLDIFQKFKANGLNTISIYFFWSYHSPVKDVFDFKTGPKNIQRLLDLAKQAGLYVIARPGPYCNAETNAGGLALWTSDGTGGKLRTSDETYHQAWLPWAKEVGEILRKNQITNGGPVIMQQIENELSESPKYESNHTLVKYMEQIKKAFRDSGIVVPFMHNEKGMRSVSWSTDYRDVGGSVNLYGLDSYPGGHGCTDVSKGFRVVRDYHQWFSNYAYTQPSFLPEFEAGWFMPWGGNFYDECIAEHDPAMPDVYYKNNIGQRVTLLSLYMAYGGTNWGHSAAPVVYTSYDYSSPLRETRQVQSKFHQTKLLALFTRVSKDLLSTQLAGSGAGYSVSTRDVWTWHLQNLDTWSNFYVLQQTDSPSRANRKFSITMTISPGAVTIPEIELDGRQSKIIVTDYWLTNSTNLLYSSAEVLTFGVFDKPVLVLYLKAGQKGEIGFPGAKREFTSYGSPSPLEHKTGLTDYRGVDQSFSKYRWTQAKGATLIDFATNGTNKEGLLVYMLDIPSAWSFFAPATTSNPNVEPNEQIFVMGPYLVRNATVSNDVLHITGDSEKKTTIEAYLGRSSVKIMTWNGKALQTTVTPYGALVAKIPGPSNRNILLPALTDWVTADSLPEVLPEYNDSSWTVCNKTTSLSPIRPLTLPSLHSSDYGYYTGIKIYRGRFDGKTATKANLTVSGGAAAGWNAWLNGKLVGGFNGNGSVYTNWGNLDFSKATLINERNVLTVVTDYHGHGQTSEGPAGPENPRGILGAKLYAGNSQIQFSEWKIQGNAGGAGGGYALDPTRGPMNEGGLYGERLGWHLPGFDASSWKKGSPTDGLEKSGIAWYSTTFKLNINADLDVPLGIEFSVPKGTVTRVQLFVNGYQYGKYVPHIGPQTRFPIPPGIINTRGSNALSLSVWAQTDNGAKLEDVRLVKYGVYETGFNFNEDWSYLQPPWTPERLKQS
ncbi:putative beta-galactosidase [Tothia fuscella]|uniref:beta-galactosidase n=1 Tax=Tothia fuscella TaxID=1048955 RepID=A0A9P4P4T1_9PEZI|nr:putative beta-galactosidase [Tothia fuscella]